MTCVVATVAATPALEAIGIVLETGRNPQRGKKTSFLGVTPQLLTSELKGLAEMPQSKDCGGIRHMKRARDWFTVTADG